MKLYNPLGYDAPENILRITVWTIVLALFVVFIVVLVLAPLFTIATCAAAPVLRILYYIFRGR